jgi:glycosyltransferase involved in cell wall biosynthesis
LYAPTDYAKDNYVLWLNRWHPAKGCAYAIEWAKRNPGQRVVIAGENPANETQAVQASYAIEMAQLAQGVSNIDFVWLPSGAEHDVRKIDLYRRANALLYTALFQEPFGLCQVEALACGTPVVGLRYGSVPEIVRAGVTGYVVADDAAVLENLTTVVESARSLVPPDCRLDAEARFDRRVMAQNYLAQYEAVLAGETW